MQRIFYTATDEMKSQYCHCGSDRIRVSFAPFNIDERTKRVHAILESLHESRFGPYRYQRNFEEGDNLWPDCLVHDATYDLMPSWPMQIPGEKLRRGLVPNCTALGSVVLANADPSTWSADFSVVQNASPLRSPPTLACG